MMITEGSSALQLCTRKCNFILSDDDRQISSVGRGRHYNSNIYNINRQSSKWGRTGAMAGMSLLSLGQRRESLDRYVRGDRVLITKADKE